MRIQHNILAMNSYRNYTNNTNALGKNLEKLSSGYKINRAGDDAAGLAISEKMRAQIQGLSAAQKNVKDGISLVKTAEGAMQEIQDMLNRMKYLATQSANGTYDDKVDRQALQDEVDNLKSEIDRIAQSANFNGIALLYGTDEEDPQDPQALSDYGIETYATGPVALGATLKNSATQPTPVTVAATGGLVTTGGVVAGTIDDVGDLDTLTLNFSVTINGKAETFEITLVEDGEFGTTGISSDNKHVAIADGMTGEEIRARISDALSNQLLKLQGHEGTKDTAPEAGTYVSSLQVNWDEEGKVKDVTVVSTTLEVDNSGGTTDKTKVKPTDTDAKMTVKTEGFGGYTVDDEVTVNGITFKFVDATASADYPVGQAGDVITVKLGSTTKETLENLAKAVNAEQDDLNFEVDNDGNLVITPAKEMTIEQYEKLLGGINLGDDDLNDALADALEAVKNELKKRDTPTPPDSDIYTPISAGKDVSLILQIGDTGDDYNRLTINIKSMDCESIGVKDLYINNKDNAKIAVDKIVTAINTVSSNRGKLGALQNRLEHTQNNLSVMAENIQDAESTIRDTDVADEMMGYVKNNILVQSAQAMLAQANQVPQGVLQLLG